MMRTITRLATVLATAAAIFALPSDANAMVGNCPVAVAHRGTTQTGYTEESIKAELLSVRLGADYAEIDVQASKDHVLYAMHDYTIERTSNGRGTLSKMTSKQIDRYRLDDGSRIPRVYDMLAALKPTGAKVFVEIKHPDSQTYDRLAKRVRSYGTKRVVINSFHTARLDRMRKVLPGVRMNLDSGAQVPVSTLRPYQSIFLVRKAVTPEYIHAVHAAGLDIYVYGTEDSLSGYGGVPAGVDGLATNDVATYQTWCANPLANPPSGDDAPPVTDTPDEAPSVEPTEVPTEVPSETPTEPEPTVEVTQ